MNILKGLIFTLCLIIVMGCNSKQDKPKETWLFNGKSLEDWKGDLRVWTVEDGCIVGRNTDEYKIKQNTFLIYKNSYSNFELTFQYKIIGGNSGVQYRAKVLDDELFVVGGYQADIEAGNNYSGILYEEKGRGIIANRGEHVVVSEEGKKEITKFSTTEEVQKNIFKEAWNNYKIVAKGNRLQHFINNTKTIDVIDNEVGKNASSGIIALQVHSGPNMTVYYKNLKLNFCDQND